MIGKTFRVSKECGGYSISEKPHLAKIKRMSNQVVKVIKSDGNGTEDNQGYLVENNKGDRAWCWKRELV